MKSDASKTTDLAQSEGNSHTADAAESLMKWLPWIGGGVGIAAIVVVTAYIRHFKDKSVLISPGDWGTFGDYIGGLLNPIVGMATVSLIVISITIQRYELRASLNEFKIANEATAQMSFEQSLFSWLSNYRELVQSVHARDATGRHALTALYGDYLTMPKIMALRSRNAVGKLQDEIAAEMYVQSIDWNDQSFLDDLDRYVLKARESYAVMYRSFQTELDSLPRTIYRLLMWIDSRSLSNEDKWHYAALVRAQCSWTELVIFFYNCYSEEGRSFAYIANRFALFDNLLPGKDVLIEHIRRLPDRQITLPLEPQAFNSVLAKRAMGIS